MIYLAGPINGCTNEQANNWRDIAKGLWGEDRCLDPMRRDYRGREDESVNGIVHGDKADILASDVVLANCWQVSVGTSMEIAFAWQWGKPVIAIVPKDAQISPWLRYHTLAIVHSLEEANEFMLDEGLIT